MTQEKDFLDTKTGKAVAITVGTGSLVVSLATENMVSQEIIEKSKEVFAEGALKKMGLPTKLAGKMSTKADFAAALKGSISSDGVDVDKVVDAVWDETQDSTRNFLMKQGAKKFTTIGEFGANKFVQLNELGAKSVSKIEGITGLKLEGRFANFGKTSAEIAAENASKGMVYDEGAELAAKKGNWFARSANYVLDKSFQAAEWGYGKAGSAVEWAGNTKLGKGVNWVGEGLGKVDDGIKAFGSKISGFIGSNLSGISKGVKAFAESPVAKFGSKALVVATPVIEGGLGVNEIVQSNKELNGENNLTDAQKEELRSQKAEGVTKTVIHGGALAAGGVLLLASNPVGWAVLAGAGMYALADWGSDKLFGKSISSAIGGLFTRKHKHKDGDDSHEAPVSQIVAEQGKSVSKEQEVKKGTEVEKEKESVPSKKDAGNQTNIEKTDTTPSKNARYTKIEDVEAFQIALNDKLKDKGIKIKQDGKFGPETTKAALAAGLGVEDVAKLLGVDSADKDALAKLEKAANSNDHSYFKQLNSRKGFDANITDNAQYAYNKLNGEQTRDLAKNSKVEFDNIKFSGNISASESTFVAPKRDLTKVLDVESLTRGS
jgi:hypothetical protein